MFLLTWLYNVSHGDLIGLVPFISMPTQPTHSTSYLPSPAPDLPCSLPPLHLDPLLLCLKYVLPTHSALSVQNYNALLPLSFFPGTPKTPVIPALVVSHIHPLYLPECRVYIHSILYPESFPSLSTVPHIVRQDGCTFPSSHHSF